MKEEKLLSGGLRRLVDVGVGRVDQGLPPALGANGAAGLASGTTLAVPRVADLT